SQARADLVVGHARVDGQDRSGVVGGLQQGGQDAELPDAKGCGALLVFYPAAEPWRGCDPGAGLGVELTEPSVAVGERAIAHLGEQVGGRALAGFDAGYLARVVADPLPELGKGPSG